jgi:hypothetical protein
VGGALTTVTEAVPLWPPLVATTENVPAVPAWNRPVDEMVPPFTDHENVGCVASGAPNWSVAVAVNCTVALDPTLALAGVTETVVNACGTVAVVALVADFP